MGDPHIVALIQGVFEVYKSLITGKRDIFDIIALLISICSLLVASIGVALTFWLVYVVQNGINNRRLLKDHFMKEVLEVRAEYLDLIRSLQAGDVSAKQVTHLFQQINVRVEDLMPILRKEFDIKQEDIRDYHINLLRIVDEADEYQQKFRGNGKVFRTIASRELLLETNKSSIAVFNSIIIQINNSN